MGHFVCSEDCRRTAVCVFDGDPTVSSRVVGLDDVRGTAATPATHDEHDLVRNARSCYRIGQVDVLAFLHVEIIQELDGLDDDWLALIVVVHQRMFLTNCATA